MASTQVFDVDFNEIYNIFTEKPNPRFKLIMVNSTLKWEQHMVKHGKWDFVPQQSMTTYTV